MSGFKSFGTFMVAPLTIVPHLNGVGVPYKWRIHLADDPSRRHWCDDEGRRAMTSFAGPPSAEIIQGQSLRPGKQIVVRCRSRTVADEVQALIHIGALLGYPDPNRYPERSGVYEVGSLAADVLASDPIADQFHWYDTAHVGAHAAIEAYSERMLIYGLEKYRFSLQLDWFTPHSGSPRYGQVFDNEYDAAANHVSAAYAIVSAYSVIEELGLDIRSSQKRPRFLDKARGDWNPVVVGDLEARLVDAGVPPDETMVWLRRGSPTAVERELRPKFGTPAEWNRKHTVRDRILSIPEAIHYSSWLRNYVAAHKFTAITEAISPYDVHNVQSVARRLLMGKLKLWRRFQ